MQQLPDTTAPQILAVNTQASGANGVITLAAPTDGSQHVIDQVIWSYAAAPNTGGMTISGIANSAGSAITLTIDITAAGHDDIKFGSAGLRAVKNTAVVVTLIDGSQDKELNVIYR